MLVALVVTAATAQNNFDVKVKPAGKSAATVKKAQVTKPKTATTATNTKPKTTTAANSKTNQATVQWQPYTILGKANNIKDGQKVYLATIENRRQKHLDSATVRNGAFTFKGKTLPFPLSRFLVTGAGFNTVTADFFLEPGTIKASITAGKRADHITGTRHNNIYVNYKDTSNLIVSKMADQYMLMSSTTAPTEDRTKARQRIDSLKQCYTDYACDFTRRNTQNMVGMFLLSEYYNQFPLADLKVILDRINKNKSFKDMPITQAVQKYYDNAVKTEEGKFFTDFNMLTLDSVPSKLSQIAGKGQPLVLYLWSVKIAASTSEVIPLKRVYRNFSKNGVQFASLCFDSDTAVINKSLKRTTPNWAQFMLPEGRGQQVMNTYNLRELPYIILFDGEGRIAARGLRRDALEEKIKNLLPQKNETN